MRHFFHCLAVTALCLAMGGCALSIPLPSLVDADQDVTGSIEKPENPQQQPQKRS